MEQAPVTFDFGMSAYTARDDDGFYRVQVVEFGGAGTQPIEAYHPAGFLGRPRDPDVDPNGVPRLGATTLYGFEGNQRHALPLNDPRVMSRLPEVKVGGSMQYADLPDEKVAFALFDGENGTYQVYVPHGSTATTIAIDTRDPDNVSIQLQHGLGHGITIEGDGNRAIRIRNAANNVQIEVNDDEFFVNGTFRVQGGAVIGGTGAKTLATVDLITWINSILRPALLAAPGGPISVAAPPAGALTTTTTAV